MKNLIASLIALLGLGSLWSDPTAQLEQIDADAACAVAYASLARAETPQPPVPVQSPKSQVSAIVKQCHPGCPCGPQCECEPCDGINCPCARERRSKPHANEPAQPQPRQVTPPAPRPVANDTPPPVYRAPAACQPGMSCYAPAQRVLRPAPAARPVYRTWGWRRR